MYTMIKKKIPGMTNKELLKARAKNKLYNFILEDGNIRGAVLHGTHMIKEMRINHGLGILETLALGHAYMAAGLMIANLKQHDRIAFKVQCSGPIKGFSVEAAAFGEVRGYLKVNPIPIDNPPESFDLAPFFGEGFLEVIHYPEYAKQPYVGHVKLIPGSIAGNLAHYFLSSQQIPTSFNLSIKFDPEGNVTGAGGLFLQALPDADDQRVGLLEQMVPQLPSIGEIFSGDETPREFIDKHFHSFSPRFLADRRVEFFCPCSKESIREMMSRMQKEILEDIAKNGPFPVEILCHNCNTPYRFDKKEMQTLI
jgi:molecular chaperone Hsp33